MDRTRRQRADSVEIARLRAHRRRGARDLLQRLVLAALLALVPTPGAAGTVSPLAPVIPYLSLRQAGVVIQSDWATCGPAAVATLLSHFFGMPATEDEIAGLATAYLPEGHDPQVTGYTLGSLKAALEALGLVSEGYRMELGVLLSYQERVGLPVLVHLDLPQPHFAVLVAARQGRLLMADPSWGMRVEATDAFALSWSGFVLVTLPPPEALAATRERTRRTLEAYLELPSRQLLEATAAGSLLSGPCCPVPGRR